MGGILAVGSFGAWLIANRYQRLANDPPRSDFDQLSQSSASLNEDSVPSDEPLATAHRLAAHDLFSDMDFTQDPIFLATGMPPQPQALVDDISTAALASLSDPLNALVEDNPPVA